MYKKVKNIIKHFYADSLYRNSVYLMASTGVMAVFGFVFWMVNARFYTSEQIGLATTLISVTSLITGFSMLGLNTALIRFLPTSTRKNEKINTGFTLVIIATVLLSIGFIIGLPWFSPKLMFLREKVGFELLFIGFVVFASLNAIVESIFVAYRSSVYVFIKNFVWSLLKLTLPLLVISLGAWGIYSAVSFATVLAVLLSIGILIYKFNYKPKLEVNKEIVQNVAKYSTGNYIAGLLGGLPTMLMPIIITNRLGAQMAAYYYMPMMIANLLYIIPQATTSSLFAEGSAETDKLRNTLRKAISINGLFLIPAMFIIYFFGKYILLIFGRDYAVEGTRLLQLLSISIIFNLMNTIGITIVNIQKDLGKLFIINMVSSFILLLLAIILIQYGLLGIGISWLLTQSIVSGLVYYFIFSKPITFVAN